MQNDLRVPEEICKSVTWQDLSSTTWGELSNYTFDEIQNINTIIRIFHQRHSNRPLSPPQSTQLIELSKAYNSKKLVLVLGSGVSMGCGLPNWTGLLKKMQNNIYLSRDDREDKAFFINKLFLKLFNRHELILARNLHHHSSSGLENDDCIVFEKFVRCALYKNTESKKSKLLAEIIRLSSDYEGEKLLDCIITYNYDDILEYYLEENNQKNYKSIYYSEMEELGTIPIYHVHGFLPRKGNLTDKNKIILSEEAYHVLYNTNNAWNNEIQLEKFIKNKCLLIGLSLNDPNLRRLLDSAKKARNNDEFHNIIVLRPRLADYRKKLKNLLKNNKDVLNEKIINNLDFEETAKMLKGEEERFFEEDALSLGVQAIWAENDADIGEKMQQIKRGP
ncbi:MAG: SIR2 family protein [Methanothrix sp.]|nr:SIR2 family protein [Methanothrix sp.]